MAKIIVGLDIGTTKIACFVGMKNEHNKLQIVSMGKSESLGVMRGIVSNIEKTVQSIKAAVEEAKSMVEGEAELSIRVVNVGIAGQHIKSLQHRGIHTRANIEDEISQKDIDALVEDMRRLLMPPGEQIIDVIPQEYIVDGEQGIKDPIGMAGVRLEANCHVITGNVGASMNITKCVAKAGLEIKNMILEPLASSEAVLNEEEKEAGVVLVDIGGGTTDIAIFQEGIIRHTAVIPFGGNVITEDIKEGCSVMRRHAEKMKTKYGSALAAEGMENEVIAIPGLRGREPKEITVKTLACIIQARMTEIIELVHYEIMNSGYHKKMIGGIVVTGGGAQLKHLTQLFEYITGMETRIGYPNEHLASTNAIEGLLSPMYSTGIGLVLMGFNEMDRIQRIQEVDNKKITVKGPTEQRSSFLDGIIKKSKEFFKDED